MSGNKITIVYEDPGDPCSTEFVKEECFPYEIDPADTNYKAEVPAMQQIDVVGNIAIKKEDENEPTLGFVVKNEGEDSEVKQFESLVLFQDEINFCDTNAVYPLPIGNEGGSGQEDGLDMKNKIKEECLAPCEIDPADTNNEGDVPSSTQQIDAVDNAVIRKENENQPTFGFNVKNEEEEDVLQSFEAVFVSQEEHFDVCNTNAVDPLTVEYKSKKVFPRQSTQGPKEHMEIDVERQQRSTSKQTKHHKCEVCSKAFSQSYHLKIHSRVHTCEKPYKCEVCNKTFSRNSNLIRHMHGHTGKKPYKCEVCNKTFSRNYNLIQHKRFHEGEKPYKCEVCNKTFSLNSHLITHMRGHTGEKAYKCEVCNKAFSQKPHLIHHMHGHTGEKPYKCEVCNKTFSQNSHLIRHMRGHTGEKPYKCEVCNKAFSQKPHLIHHMHGHTGEKPYKCEVCNKTFSQNSHLMRHMRVHCCEKPYKCEVCNKAFSTSSILSSHVQMPSCNKP